MTLSWYNFSTTWFFTFLGRAFNWSFRILQKFGIGPNVFYIALVCALLIIWLFMMRRYDGHAKDKGLID
jgi:tellurite resistance protein TehA-like permease